MSFLREYAVSVVSRHLGGASVDRIVHNHRAGGSRTRNIGDVPTRAAEILADQTWLEPAEMVFTLADEYLLRAGMPNKPLRRGADVLIALGLELQGRVL